jgi:hypothetical protein
MELPAELRVMIARYALYVPGGLSWLWTNYRKGPRVATLVKGSYKKGLERVTGLSRTCRAVHEETKGIKFSFYRSHVGNIPGRCYDPTHRSDDELRAFAEALAFLRTFVPQEMRPDLAHVELTLWEVDVIEDYIRQFKSIVEDHGQQRITFVIRAWKLLQLDDLDLKKLAELEEEGEPYVPEEEQMQQRIQSYMETGQRVKEIVKRVGSEDKTWRIFPQSIHYGVSEDILEYLTGKQHAVMSDWQQNGI